MFRRAVVVALGIFVSLGVASAVRAQPRPAAAPPRPASHPPPRPAARELKIAVMFGSDRASTDAALAGLEAAKKRGRIAVASRVAPRAEAQAAEIDRLAVAAPDLIIGVGPLYADAFRAASARHPGMRFLLLDADALDAPNVRSVTFRVDEGSFLAGVAAAAESKRGAVGFVGAMETQVVQALECGYETGIRWAVHELKRTVRGSVVYIGTTPEAFADPAHGAAVSRSLITQKDVDVLYAAAGASSAGVIDAAREANVRAIGVDATHTHLTRDVFITSVRKRFDRAIDRAIADVRKQAFRGGGAEMNLANGGVDLALPGRLAPRTLKLVEKARAALVSGGQAACVPYEEPPLAWNFPPRPAAP
jgi:basic membrane protein A